MIYFAWLSNQTNRKDDDWMKIRAASYEEARSLAIERMDSRRFSFRYAVTRKEFKKIEPWIHSIEWGRPCINDKETQ